MFEHSPPPPRENPRSAPGLDQILVFFKLLDQSLACFDFLDHGKNVFNFARPSSDMCQLLDQNMVVFSNKID